VLGHDGALQHIVGFVRDHLQGRELLGVGHRVVHGGMAYAQPVRIDGTVLDDLAQFVPLAPLHQPHNLTPIRLLAERQPDLPQVACFDTAFHRAQPELAQRFALPGSCTTPACAVMASTACRTSTSPRCCRGSTPARRRAHRGLPSRQRRQHVRVVRRPQRGQHDGLHGRRRAAMGTRCGALDPGVILYLMDQHGMDARAIEKLIYSQSGLLGVSGVSSDMRTLLASSEPGARIAVDLYVYRIGRELGSLAAALAVWTRSCSPGASARTAPRSVSASAVTRSGSAWRWTKRPTAAADRASARRLARPRRGRFPPTKN